MRSNYNNQQRGIYATTEYIECFFRNFILGENNELKNRHLLIDNQDKKVIQSAKNKEQSTSSAIFAF